MGQELPTDLGRGVIFSIGLWLVYIYRNSCYLRLQTERKYTMLERYGEAFSSIILESFPVLDSMEPVFRSPFSAFRGCFVWVVLEDLGHA